MITQGELFQMYMRGFRRGASTGIIDERSQNASEPLKEAFFEGYRMGKKELGKAHKRASKRYRHEPSILRTQD